MELQSCECALCEALHKKFQPPVFKESENTVPIDVCHEPNLTSSTSTLIIDEPTSPDNTMDTTIAPLIIDEPMSSDNTEVATIPTLVVDETTSPIVNQLFTRRSDRTRKPIQKLNL